MTSRTLSITSGHRRRMAITVPCVFAMVVATGCASTKIANQHQLVTGQIARPGHIWVYPFAATPADMPPGSALAGQYSESAPQTPQQVAEGRKLGSQIATELATQIQAMGMPGVVAGPETALQINDIVIRGYLVSVNEGSAAERVAIGFGSGSSSLSTAVEGFQVTPQGMRKLGGGDVNAAGGKSPGAALGVVGLIATGNPVGLLVNVGMKAYGEGSGSATVEGRAKSTAKEIADVLKQRFQQQGWIQ